MEYQLTLNGKVYMETDDIELLSVVDEYLRESGKAKTEDSIMGYNSNGQCVLFDDGDFEDEDYLTPKEKYELYHYHHK